jgi:hypothetical protein
MLNHIDVEVENNLDCVIFILKDVLRVIFISSSRHDGRLEEKLFASLEFTYTTMNFVQSCLLSFT